MNPENFWSLIEKSRFAAAGDLRKQMPLLLDSLGALSDAEIVAFDRQLEELHIAAYSWQLWGAAYLIGGGCSDDGFADFRGWLISRGRQVYEAAVRDPDSLADVMTTSDGDGQIEGFECLASQAWEKKTGKSMREFPRIPLTYPVQPSGEPWQEETLESCFPKIAALTASRNTPEAIAAEQDRLQALIAEQQRQKNADYAAKILLSMKTRFSPENAYRLLAQDEISEVAAPYLANASAILEPLGFQRICDYGNVHIKDKQGSLIAMRVHVAPDYTLRVLSYYFPSLDKCIYELDSDLSDGRELHTSNAEAGAKFDAASHVLREMRPYDTPLAEMLELHRQRMKALPDVVTVTPTMPHTPDQCVARSMKLARTKFEDKQKKGWATEKEFRRLLPKTVDDSRAAALYVEFKRLAAGD